MDTGSTPDGALLAVMRKYQEECLRVLKKRMAYQLIPHSGKVVVFDSELSVLHAFNGLLYNDINCAPVWDSGKRKYVGMLSVTDFIDILRHSYTARKRDPAFSLAIGEQRICDWQAIKRSRGTSINRLLCISPECSLHEAVRLLIDYRIHRLCVVQLALGNTVLCVLSHHNILRSLVQQVRHLHGLKLTVQQAGVGVFEHVVTVKYSTPLMEALELLITQKLSALPIVDDAGHVVDYYARSDTRFLATGGKLDNLGMTLQEALGGAEQKDRTIPSCHITDEVWTVCRRLISTHSHMLLCLNADNTMQGFVCLTDIFIFLLNQQPKPDQQRASSTNDEQPQAPTQHHQQGDDQRASGADHHGEGGMSER